MTAKLGPSNKWSNGEVLDATDLNDTFYEKASVSMQQIPTTSGTSATDWTTLHTIDLSSNIQYKTAFGVLIAETIWSSSNDTGYFRLLITLNDDSTEVVDLGSHYCDTTKFIPYSFSFNASDDKYIKKIELQAKTASGSITCKYVTVSGETTAFNSWIVLMK